MKGSRRHTDARSIGEGYDALRAGYEAARASRFNRALAKVGALGTSADWHIRNWQDNLRMMELARYFDRNDLVVGQGLNRLIDNVVQDGFRLDLQSGDSELDKDVGLGWNTYADTAELCDAAAEHTVHELAALSLRGMIVDGDSLAVIANDGVQIESFEAHRCRSPVRAAAGIVNGITVDKTRKRTAFHITKADVGIFSRVQASKMQEVPTRDSKGLRQVLQVYRPNRVSQTRGITAFARIHDAVGMHGDLEFAKLAQAQAASCFAILIESGADTQPLGGTPVGGTEERTGPTGEIEALQKLAPGLIIEPSEGKQIKGFSPNIPNPEFFEHTTLVLTFIAINLGIPVAMLLLDPSQTNFSGWRGAMDQARMGFKALQKLMVQRYYEPLFARWLAKQAGEDKAVQKSLGRNGLARVPHRWQPPTWRYIQPLQDAQADGHRINTHLSSQRRVQGEGGRLWEEVSAEIAADNGLLIRHAIEQAQAIRNDTGETDVTWRDLLTVSQPKRQSRPGSTGSSNARPGTNTGQT